MNLALFLLALAATPPSQIVGLRPQISFHQATSQLGLVEMRFPLDATTTDTPHRYPFIHAEINGVRGLFLIDTGASHCVITRGFAQKAGFSELRRVDIPAADDTSSHSLISHVESFKIGNNEYGNFDVFVYDLFNLNKCFNPGLDGIIGLNLLELKPFEINFKEKFFRIFSEPGAFNEFFKSDDKITSVNLTHTSPLIGFAALLNKTSVPFFLDTGSPVSFLQESWAKKLNLTRSGSPQFGMEANIKGTFPNVAYNYYLVKVLELGGIVKTSCIICSASTPTDENIIGCAFFHDQSLLLDLVEKRMFIKE
jgi:predicted aspartyl protease